jgi:uncharacterized membrane protein YphA (DoxX/SURF4 family)
LYGERMAELPLYSLVVVSVFLARLLVGTVLLVAGLAKLRMPTHKFFQVVMGYSLVPRPVALVLAHGLPWVEITLGGLLLVGLWSHLVSLASIALLLIFSSGIALNLLRGKRNECGCFQSLTPVQWKLIFRNLLLVALLLSVYTFHEVK